MAGYEPIETASIDELRTLQTERLQSTLHRAYANIDHYTRAFDAAGVHPDDVTSLDDLARLPFLVKDDPRGVSVRDVRRAARISCGSTPPRARPVNRRSSVTPPPISTPGPP